MLSRRSNIHPRRLARFIRTEMGKSANTTGASAHHRHENDTNVQSKGSNSVGMVLVGAVLDVHSKKSWPPVCEKMLLNMPVMTMVRFA